MKSYAMARIIPSFTSSKRVTKELYFVSMTTFHVKFEVDCSQSLPVWTEVGIRNDIHRLTEIILRI